ncbi:MAG: hypothetical protein V3U68_04585 [Bacteroidota bacterium]
MIKLLLVVLILVGFHVFRRSQFWKNLLSDPKIQERLMVVGGVTAWTVVVLVLFAAVEFSITLLAILRTPSLYMLYSLIGVAIILSAIALGIQYIIAVGNPRTLGNFRTLFSRLLVFQVTELQKMQLEEEPEKMEVQRIEEETPKQSPPSDKHDRGTMDHFGIE